MLSSALGRLLRVVFEEVDDLPPMSPIVARGWSTALSPAAGVVRTSRA
jgi:hypothetical protein